MEHRRDSGKIPHTSGAFSPIHGWVKKSLCIEAGLSHLSNKLECFLPLTITYFHTVPSLCVFPFLLLSLSLRRSLRTRWTSWSRWSLCWSNTRWMLRSSRSSRRRSGTFRRCWRASRRNLGPMTTMSSTRESCDWTAGSAAAWAN